jgi:hypothetical protein
MVELFLIVVGLALTGLLALIKVVFAIAALTWFWVWVPVFVVLLVAFGVWLPDLS